MVQAAVSSRHVEYPVCPCILGIHGHTGSVEEHGFPPANMEETLTLLYFYGVWETSLSRATSIYVVYTTEG